MSDTLYILGLKRRGEDSYRLTSWSGDAPLCYAIYSVHPGYGDYSTKHTPMEIGTEEELEQQAGWNYLGFGWLAEKAGESCESPANGYTNE